MCDSVCLRFFFFFFPGKTLFNVRRRHALQHGAGAEVRDFSMSSSGSR
jgi:hypothetical protein